MLGAILKLSRTYVRTQTHMYTCMRIDMHCFHERVHVHIGQFIAIAFFSSQRRPFFPSILLSLCPYIRYHSCAYCSTLHLLKEEKLYMHGVSIRCLYNCVSYYKPDAILICSYTLNLPFSLSLLLSLSHSQFLTSSLVRSRPLSLSDLVLTHPC